MSYQSSIKQTNGSLNGVLSSDGSQLTITDNSNYGFDALHDRADFGYRTLTLKILNALTNIAPVTIMNPLPSSLLDNGVFPITDDDVYVAELNTILNWVTLTAYVTGNVVVDNNGTTIYMATQNFTSGVSFAADLALGRWTTVGVSIPDQYRSVVTFAIMNKLECCTAKANLQAAKEGCNCSNSKTKLAQKLTLMNHSIKYAMNFFQFDTAQNLIEDMTEICDSEPCGCHSNG